MEDQILDLITESVNFHHKLLKTQIEKLKSTDPIQLKAYNEQEAIPAAQKNFKTDVQRKNIAIGESDLKLYVEELVEQCNESTLLSGTDPYKRTPEKRVSFPEITSFDNEEFSSDASSSDEHDAAPMAISRE